MSASATTRRPRETRQHLDYLDFGATAHSRLGAPNAAGLETMSAKTVALQAVSFETVAFEAMSLQAVALQAMSASCVLHECFPS